MEIQHDWIFPVVLCQTFQSLAVLLLLGILLQNVRRYWYVVVCNFWHRHVGLVWSSATLERFFHQWHLTQWHFGDSILWIHLVASVNLQKGQHIWPLLDSGKYFCFYKNMLCCTVIFGGSKSLLLKCIMRD